jgi:hypothetical protein
MRENKYNLKMVDITDQINPSNIVNPFGNIDIEKFWDWNHDIIARHGWDDKLDDPPNTKTYEKLLVEFEKIIFNKHRKNIIKYGISHGVGPFHFKIMKDNRDAYICFGYFIKPGVYLNYFHMFIPDENNSLDWIYTWEYEHTIENFLKTIDKPFNKLIVSIPEKSPMIVHFWRRKAMKSWRKIKNPGHERSYTYIVDFDFTQDRV